MKTDPEKLQFLKHVHLFNDISEDYIQSLLDVMEMKTFERDQDIIKEGEQGDSLFILFKGNVTVTKKMNLFADYHERSRVDKALIRLKDTDYAFFGEMTLCGKSEQRSATVTAETDCLLGELAAKEIHNLVAKHSEFGSHFYQNLSEVLVDRLRKANRDILKLTTALSLALEE